MHDRHLFENSTGTELVCIVLVSWMRAFTDVDNGQIGTTCIAICRVPNILCMSVVSLNMTVTKELNMP